MRLLDILEVRRAVRRVAGARQNNIPVLEAREPDRAPIKIGESCHWETKSGVPIRFPSAYQKKGWSNMTYGHSSRAIVVGRRWLGNWLDQPENSELKARVVFARLTE